MFTIIYHVLSDFQHNISFFIKILFNSVNLCVSRPVNYNGNFYAGIICNIFFVLKRIILPMWPPEIPLPKGFRVFCRFRPPGYISPAISENPKSYETGRYQIRHGHKDTPSPESLFSIVNIKGFLRNFLWEDKEWPGRSEHPPGHFLTDYNWLG
jgi:hypothetical protein